MLHGWDLTGIMDRKEGGDSIYIYDLNIYASGSGGGFTVTAMISQTVCHLVSNGLALPEFVLAPENIMDRAMDLISHTDIDFDDFPQFSKKYLLKAAEGGDSEQVRSLFQPDLLSFFENHLKYTARGGGDAFLLYRSGKVLTSEAKLNTLLDEARHIAGMLKR